MTIALVGTNWHGVKAELDTLTSEFVREHGDLALERIDGFEAEYEQILGAIESLPFLASKKMVVIQNLSQNKQASEALGTLIERAGDSTDLVVVESKVDKRSVYYKQLKKLADFKEFNELDENALAGWLATEAKQQKAVLSTNDARFLVERVGANQTALARELEKLVQYDPKITRQTIELLTDETPSSTIFNLIDSAFSGNLEQALRIYADQRAQKVEPQAMHAMLVWQMHAVALCAQAPNDKSAQDIAKDAGMSPYVVQKSQNIARRMGKAKILEILTLLRDIDHRSKHHTLDYDEAMKFIIISLAN
jgi:DNA polymerase III subunit delta